METNQLVPRWLIGVLGVLLTVFVATLIIEKIDSLKDKLENKKPQNTISVSAEGKAEGNPDLATVSVGVLSEGSTAVAVKDENNRKVNAIVDFIKKQGVPEKDITTSQFYFYPQQDWRDGKSTIIGYQGNQTVTVKMRGVDRSQDQLEKVLDGVVNTGANQIQGVSFSFSDPDGLKQQARKEAIAKAKEKAGELAQEAGLRLGKVVSISESSSPYPGPVPYASDYALGRGGAEKSVAPDIQPGTQEIVQTITVVFEVK